MAPSEPRQFAKFEMLLTAFDVETDRRRWNGGPLASDEAHEALMAGVEAFQAAVKERGLRVVRTGYGVHAEEVPDES